VKIRKFEEIEAWKEARILTSMVYKVSRQKPFSRDFGLSNQIQRAAVSVMSNIAEGFLCQSNREFVRYLFIALRSTAEVQSQLYVALDLGYIDQNQFDLIYDQASKAAKLINGFINYLTSLD